MWLWQLYHRSLHLYHFPCWTHGWWGRVNSSFSASLLVAALRGMGREGETCGHVIWTWHGPWTPHDFASLSVASASLLQQSKRKNSEWLKTKTLLIALTAWPTFCLHIFDDRGKTQGCKISTRHNLPVLTAFLPHYTFPLLDTRSQRSLLWFIFLQHDVSRIFGLVPKLLF